MNTPLKFKTIPLGAVVTFVLLSVFTGGFNQAFALILVSVVCTGGIGLALWIPLWWAVGIMSYWVLEALQVIKSKNLTEISEKVKISKEELALNNYIYSARQQRLTDLQIKNLLLSKGWKENDINSALSSNINVLFSK